ncbi:MAG: hypothetical protein KatS3mg057_2232 [Herpetosiphonaceae bacterium]|nr:MAG: hypothetical protein KatS3mg057_2232 [Herpetosiphonaceae bacterium]
MENQIEDIYELSPLQQGILFHTLFDPGTGVYTIQNTFPMEGELDLPLFERAWNKVIERHPILRTSFHWEGLDKPVQVVRRRAAMTIERYDWQHLAESEQEQQLEAFLQEDRRRGFDLTSPPLMRLTLIQTGDQRYQFVWSLHHLLLDGWSIALLRGEVFRIYMALCMGQPIDLPTPRPFGDYIAWLQQRDLGAAESFWRRTLQGLSAPTSLPAGNPHPEEVEPGQEYGEAFLTISAQTTAAIQSLVKQQRLTLNTLMQGVWALLLSRYSGERDVLFGATVSGRPTTLEGVESMIGLFINTLPVRVHVDPQRPLLDWLSDLQTHQVELRNYEYTPLVQIQSWSEIPRGQPLFESLFVFENYVQTPDVPQHERRLRVGPSRGLDPTNYPLSLMVIPMAEGHGPEATQQIYLRSVYDRRRFDAASIKRILGHAQAVVEAIAANPHQRVGDLSILTPAEYDQLIVAWNRTTVHYQPRLLHQLVEEQARRTPAAVAVVSEAGELTYAELDQRANQLAHYLCSLGVGPETFVGVCVDRSPAMVVAIVAILKAGGAYVPLDPTYPPERLAFMASDARIKVLLTQSHLQSRIAAPGLQVLALDSGWQAVAQQPADPLNVNVNGDTVAYSIYTSGSTGQPKGVLTSHAAIVNRLLWAQETYPLGEADRVLQQASFSFDFAVWEIFAPLITGARLILPAPRPAPGYRLSHTLDP